MYVFRNINNFQFGKILEFRAYMSSDYVMLIQSHILIFIKYRVGKSETVFSLFLVFNAV